MVDNPEYLYELVLKSFDRCRSSAGFADDFYGHLKAFLPNAMAEELFNIHREWLRAMLEIGIGHVLLFSHNPDPVTAGKIASLRDSYFRLGLNLVHGFGVGFQESLIAAVSRNDPVFDGRLADAWRQAAKPAMDEIAFCAGTPAE